MIAEEKKSATGTMYMHFGAKSGAILAPYFGASVVLRWQTNNMDDLDELMLFDLPILFLSLCYVYISKRKKVKRAPTRKRFLERKKYGAYSRLVVPMQIDISMCVKQIFHILLLHRNINSSCMRIEFVRLLVYRIEIFVVNK